MDAERLNLLIVDDDDEGRDLLAKSIAWERYGVRLAGEAASAHEALRIMERESIQLVMTDICMPNMDGLELADRIRRKYPGVFVVLLTAYEDFEFARKAILAGVSNYILKPIDHKDVKKTLQLIRQQRAAGVERSTENDRRIQETSRPAETDLLPEESALGAAVKVYIQEHFCEAGLKLASSAEHFHVSPGYLSRKFKQEFGVGFTDYLNDLRVQEAIRLMRDEKASVSEAAERVGIEDPHYFSTMFKRYTGMRPSAYRQRD